MLKLDPFSEDILFECDYCKRVGERDTQVVEEKEEGAFYCWSCFMKACGGGQKLAVAR